MQLAGSRFTDATAVFGNDLATLPNFPAEIRAPAGTLAGVSAFQIHFASRDILTPGRRAERARGDEPRGAEGEPRELERGATIIVNEDAFSKRNLEKAGYEANPLEDGSLSGSPGPPDPDDDADHARGRGHRGRVHARRRPRQEPVRARRAVVAVRATDRRHQALDRAEVRAQAGASCRPTWPRSTPAGRSARRPSCSTSSTASIAATDVAPGTYRNVNGTTALSLGLIAASVRSGLPLVLASYPITPASELLHELSRHARFGVRTIQAEDEIAAAGMALGAAFGGRLGVTATSGPGMDLKAETIGLAVMLELPMIVVDVQRAGPLDRHADEDRAVGPADGAVRPSRRVAAAGDRAEHPGRLLRRRVRGGAGSRSATARR